MHGCYNGIGLWFIEGLAGIVVDASAQPPLFFRAAVEVADITWASGSRYVCGVRLVLNDVQKTSFTDVSPEGLLWRAKPAARGV
jgi:hypothetical protein